MSTRVTTLLLFAAALLATPVQAEFWAISNLDLQVTKDTAVSPPQYWLEGFTFADYTIPGDQLVVGQSTGAVNVDDDQGRRDITLADNLELNDFAPRNGAVPPEITTVNFGGSPTWEDTNGDNFDFFIFEAGGNDEFAVQAVLPGGVLGQKVIVPASKWKDLGPEPAPDLKRQPGPNNNQPIHGIAFKITDLLDDGGTALTNESVIEGLVFTSPGMDPSCICAVKGSVAASGPDPTDGAVLGSQCTLLRWSPGMNALSEQVYFSENREDVDGLAASALLATVTLPAASVCVPGTPYADGLVPGTYYWRVVSTDDAQGTAMGPVWSFTIIASSAFDPVPADGGLYVAPETTLSWTAGADAIIHYVFIGTDRDAVAGAVQADGAPSVEPTFTPVGLDQGATYYWRVDEFNGTTTTAGEIWSFSTLPIGEGGLKAEYFASEEPLYGDPVVERVDAQVDFDWNQNAPDSSLDRLLFSARWKGEISIPADGTYTFITQSNDGSRVYVDEQLVLQDWSTHVVRDAVGTITLAAGTYPIAVEYFQQGGSAEMHLLWESNLIPRQIIPSVALTPAVRARLIYPADGAINVSQQPRLRWEPAAIEAQHDVYLGEDAIAVDQATTNTAGIHKGQQEEATYIAMLEPGLTYHWRIDEVIPGDPQSPIKGRLWSFQTAAFAVIDDFENYIDAEPDRIFDTWVDGWDNLANGSIVGHEIAPFAEQDIVHSGGQSMIMQYDNSGTAASSEAERTFTTSQDWTTTDGQDLKALAIWYRGVAPVGSFNYDAAKSQYTVGGSGDGVDGSSDGFRLVYKKMTGDGVITARLETMGRTADWAVAGVMFRETLEPGSPMAMSGVRATGQAFLRWRDFANVNLSGTIEVPEFPATIVIPHYIRLTRQGSSFLAEHSSDGTTWENIGNSVTVPMGQQVYVGLAVSANVADAQNVVNTAVFSNVDTTGTVDAAGPFQNVKDIGMGGNVPAPLYAVVQDAAGKTAIVTNPDGPDAIVTNNWTEWLVDLADIAGQGVNLGAVKKLAIGVGNRTGGATGATGTLYIDDVRLYDARFLGGGLTVGPITSVEVTGDNGMVLSINGISVSDLILGTTRFAGAPKWADQPASNADDFDAGSSASADDQAYLETVFPVPVSTIFVLEKGANDDGYIQAIGTGGSTTGSRVAFKKVDFFKSSYKFGGQNGGGLVISAVSPVYGIRILPPDNGPLGIDAVCIAGVPAQ